MSYQVKTLDWSVRYWTQRVELICDNGGVAIDATFNHTGGELDPTYSSWGYTDDHDGYYVYANGFGSNCPSGNMSITCVGVAPSPAAP